MAKKWTIVMAGNISKDIMVDYQGNEIRLNGGATTYASTALACTGVDALIVSNLSDDEKHLEKELASGGVVWEFGHTPEMTSMKNIYLTADKERRKIDIISVGRPFTLGEIERHDADIYYLAGLFVGEIPDSFILPLSKKGRVAIDAQGILRDRDSENKIYFHDWERKAELLPHVCYLKTDAAEAQVLTGMEDREEAARQLSQWGAKEVMVTHNTEVLVCVDGTIYRSRYTNSNNSGRTGRGDTTFSSYLAWRMGHGIQESLDFCTALCSLKMEKPGRFSLDKEAVFQRMREQYGYSKEYGKA